MNVHAPLVMYISSRAKKSCHFYDISTRVKYGTKLPTCVGKKFLGCSSGYLIFQDFHKKIWVINPLTGHKLRFPNMPQTKKPLNGSDRAIFASFGSGSDFALMVLSKTHETIRYCISRDTNARWRYLSFAKESWKIVDLVVFDGRVYALTNNSRIGVFNLRTRRFWFLTLEGTPWLTTFVRLVASKKQLLIVHFLPTISRAKVYTIDLERLKWVEVEDLGDEALFLGAWIQSNQQYEACSHPYACGSSIHDVWYPFWGNGRPRYCGRQGFELKCHEDSKYPVIEFETQKFQYSPNVIFLNLFYDCSGEIKEETNTFSCREGAGFYTNPLDVLQLQNLTSTCKKIVQVPVRSNALENYIQNRSDFQEVLNQGFDVVYEVDNSSCSQCISSVGFCGSDNSSSDQFVCFCIDKPNTISCDVCGTLRFF
ncbi:hypothetical protein JRO89_XS10G0028600 [Xanthoceras sorbifolium]|uniref:non-specific serine/threonine protein kinase n=1 Tax=Xanthoceras sorbifolium TaxID=99658 RepID=A0ABQ8HHF3_9ROSI|nr:hypothetical protein JRO89_XS10G0028600 [Xanthoceras sorbifolium]